LTYRAWESPKKPEKCKSRAVVLLGNYTEENLLRHVTQEAISRVAQPIDSGTMFVKITVTVTS